MRAADPERLADLLQERHPDAEPFETDPALVAVWLAEAGADPDDDGLAVRVLRAWEGRRG